MNKQEISVEEAIEVLRRLTFHFCKEHKKRSTEDTNLILGAINKGMDALTQQLNNGWIPVTERMPKEKENPITRDYYSYECTFTSDITTEVRYYSFGGGHWWHGHACVDGYVTAWRKRPEPYKEAL